MTTEKRKSWKSLRLLLTCVQVVISAGLIVWLFRSIDFHDFLTIFLEAAPAFMLLACINFYFGILIAGIKWQYILRLEEIQIPLPRLVRWILIGSFANNFLPTDIGGDLGRILIAGRSSGKTLIITRTVFVERLTGLIVLAAVSAAALFFWGIMSEMILLLAIGGLLMPVVIRNFSKLPIKLPPFLSRYLDPLYDSWNRYMAEPRKLIQILILSVFVQLIGGFGVWLNFRAVGIDLPYLQIYLVASVANLASLLPLFINGWGIKEAIFLSLLGSNQIAAGNILAAQLLGRVLLVIVTLIGPVLALFETDVVRPKHAIEKEKM